MKKLSLINLAIILLLINTKSYSQWVELGGNNNSIFTFPLLNLASDSSNNIYATAGPNLNGRYYIAKYDGTNWSELGGTNTPHIGDNSLNCLSIDRRGNLYSGGNVYNSQPPKTGFKYLAKWDGIKWSEVGGLNVSNFNNTIRCVLANDTNDIYVGGLFTNGFNFGGNYYVAKFDGANWSELGGNFTSTFNAPINTIVSDANGNVYVGGNFGNTNNKCYVAKFNGNSWTELGGTNNSNFNGQIRKLIIGNNGHIFAVGDFTNLNGYNYVAEWDGISWNEVGGLNNSTFSYSILNILNYDGDLYLCGGFTNSTGNYFIAKWDGFTWSTVGVTSGSLINNSTYDIILDASGNMYTSGVITNPSGYFCVAVYTNLTSINEPIVNNSIVFPNPTNDELNIQVETSVIGSTYQLTDITGRHITTGLITEEKSRISLQGLSSGTYLLSIGDQIRKTLKVVKE